eukprot:Sspe_Gene.30752::Locus_15196_Transcript_5_5_Confidence_0.500_Length_1107::g.30752::m.30752
MFRRPMERILRVGEEVVAHGLVNQPTLNGRSGRVVRQQGERVVVDFGEGIGMKALRGANLRSARDLVLSFCHTCGRQVGAVPQMDGELRCPCGSTFVEEIDAPPLRPIIPIFPFPFIALDDDFIEYMAAMSMQDGPKGPPPASEAEVQKLEKTTITTKDEGHVCTVCQDAFEVNDEATKMPCGHDFHSDCLGPWLRQANSCPTCRFELKTDDADYEMKKQEQQQQREAA